MVKWLRAQGAPPEHLQQTGHEDEQRTVAHVKFALSPTEPAAQTLYMLTKRHKNGPKLNSVSHMRPSLDDADEFRTHSK